MHQQLNMNHLARPKATSFRIARLYYYPSVEQHPLYLRPYNMVANKEAHMLVENVIDENAGKMFRPETFAAVTPHVLQPSGVPYETSINNSFLGEGRYEFRLEVIHSTPIMGIKKRFIYQGHTNGEGIGRSAVAEDMVHYVDSVTVTTIQVEGDELAGIPSVEKLEDSFDIIRPMGALEITYQRSRDILSDINMSNYVSDVSDRSNLYVGDTPVTNVMGINMMSTVNASSGRLEGSSYANHVGANYLSTILEEGVRRARQEAFNVSNDDIFSIADHGGLKDDLSGMFGTDPTPSADPFLKMCRDLEGRVYTTGEFTYGTLAKIDPAGLNAAWQVIHRQYGGANDPMVNTPSVGDYWNGQDPITTMAYSMILEALALSKRMILDDVYLHVDNRTSGLVAFNADTTCLVSRAKASINVSGGDEMRLAEGFKRRFFNEVYAPRTSMGSVPMALDLYISKHAVSKIRIEYAGYPENWYTLPTVYSGYVSPVINPDFNTKTYNVELFKNFINTAADASSIQTHQPIIQQTGIDGMSAQPYTDFGY